MSIFEGHFDYLTLMVPPLTLMVPLLRVALFQLPSGVWVVVFSVGIAVSVIKVKTLPVLVE